MNAAESHTEDAYARIAEWYDLEHDALTDDIECFESVLTTLGQTRLRVLEIGSGSGRIAAALALAGHEVVGVEPSPAMRARAVRRLAALPERVARRVRWTDGSAEAPGIATSPRFDAALVSLNTFAHVTTLASRSVALRQVYERLAPGGLLLLDLDPQGVRHLAHTPGQLWWQGTWPVPQSSALVSHFVAAAQSATPGVVSVTHFYDVHEQNGSVRRTVATMALALLSVGEMTLALQGAGFERIEVFGGYDCAPYEDGAPRAIFQARRPNAS